jgi:CHAT domain-containing protein
VSKILGLRLNADWVVLSACNTAAAGGAGAEAVSGLGLAFFYAGSRTLLVSNWPVETTSARILTTELFKREAASPGIARAEALRQAMLSLIDGPGMIDPLTQKPVYSYAHPLFWAPFSLVGDGGAG